MINTCRALVKAFVFNGVNNLIKYCIINAYYKDTPMEDICSSLTGVKAIHWITQPEVCEEFIEKHIQSITTTIFCAYGLLLLFGFLIYIPIDIYKGTKSIITQVTYKALGIASNKNVDDSNKKIDNSEKNKQKALKDKETKTKNTINGRLADDLLRFLGRLKQLNTLQELLILLKALNDDAFNELLENDKRKEILQTNPLPDFLQIKNE